MVGDPTCLATSCMLACFYLYPKRSYSYWGNLNSGWWHLHLDIARVFFAPFSFPYENNKLLVRSLSVCASLNFSLHDVSISNLACWSKFEKFSSGETPYTISFMVAITSTLWMVYDLFSPQLQQQFCVCQYVNLLETLYLPLLNYLSRVLCLEIFFFYHFPHLGLTI